MPHSYGFKARTRKLLSKDFRKHGMPSLQTYMRVYKIGDYVDIKINGSVHKGMPHRIYHGKTGRVFTVFPNLIGVVVHLINGNHYEEKRLYVRVEHISPSKCQEDLKKRLKDKMTNKKETVEKRVPKEPRKAHVVSGKIPPAEINIVRKLNLF